GCALVRARELLDLLTRSTNVTPQGVDDRVELCFEVVPVLDETCRLRARARSIWTDIQGTAMRMTLFERVRTLQPSSDARTATGSLGATSNMRTPRRAMTSRQPGAAARTRE